MISIKGLNKVELLKRMWTNMKPASFFSYNNVTPPKFDETEAQDAVNSYIDYF